MYVNARYSVGRPIFMKMVVDKIEHAKRGNGYWVYCSNKWFNGSMKLFVEENLPAIGDRVFVSLQWRKDNDAIQTKTRGSSQER